MEITKKRQFNDIALGFYLLSHPVPVMFHILAVTVFTLLAAWPHFAWSIIALVIAAHAAMQISIAMLNDYRDRRLDSASRPGKPISRGLIHGRAALIGSFVIIAIILILLVQLPLLSTLSPPPCPTLGPTHTLRPKSPPLPAIL